MIPTTEKTSEKALCVNSCAKQVLSTVDQRAIRKNGRADWHILFITHGFCTVNENGKETRIGAGNIILFRPFQPQEYSFLKKDRSVSRYIHFCGKKCQNLLENAGITSLVTYVGENAGLENLHQKLCEEFATKKPMYEEICAAVLAQFIMTAGRLALYNRQNANIKNIRKIDEICLLMHEEILKNRSMSEYAKMCNLSPDRFYHTFKDSIGVSPKQYMTNIRLNTATELLLNADMSIAQVAAAVGYSDANYFSRLMKKHTGHSPKYFTKA